MLSRVELPITAPGSRNRATRSRLGWREDPRPQAIDSSSVWHDWQLNAFDTVQLSAFKYVLHTQHLLPPFQFQSSTRCRYLFHTYIGPLLLLLLIGCEYDGGGEAVLAE